MTKFYAMLLLSLFGFISGAAQEKWTLAHENEKVKIEYVLTDCIDAANGFNFEYYILKIENKTNASLNLQYILGTPSTGATEEEISTNLILKPREIVKGACTDDGNLKYFSKDNSAKNARANQFLISKIKTYAL
ncbi:hypothetical protein QRD02_13595 [Aequorivita sp. SDUM287046]|uniref:Uncharacterized protein n=1 Tax=Aequorivita aurantiaca TaxID=3053356 RepID=A0ABT8DJ50_9FLAO|nr:hypothetical protein [Aequorivita aurantiaca]MDN3725417.1 hypothetical protein [Aequorivita aurantiaca]